MASAFVSYAHEDQEFVLALVEHLQAQGVDIRYDQVVLRIGDSLIRAISQEIAEGDFVIAIVSPDSVASEWCQKELALAATHGINERRVKVLPVRFRGVEMPPMLHDTYWADGDRDDVETLARRLAAAMRAHMEGRETDAGREAEEAEPSDGVPAHAEMAGDVTVAQIEEVAQRVWDVFGAWGEVWDRGGNVRDLDDPQRRLRWALDALPERIRAGLPLVEHVASASPPFDARDTVNAELDIREELRSVRTQVAQGLSVTRRWTIEGCLGQGNAGRRDAIVYVWRIRRDDAIRTVEVFISGTAMASENEYLPSEVARAKDTEGRSAVATLVALDDPPAQVMVSTAGISHTLPA